MDPTECNRAHRDAPAAVHGQDAYSGADAPVSGRASLDAHGSAAVGDVTGPDVRHLQCHAGGEFLTLSSTLRAGC